MLYRSLFTQLIREGTLRLVDAGGQTRVLGDGGRPQCTLRLHDRLLEYRLPTNPSLYFAEAYIDGRITIGYGSLEDFLAMTLRNYNRLQDHWLFKAFAVLAREGRWVKHYNPVGRARRNVAHHYDLSGALYDLFLDRDRQYSCGYFM